MNPNFLEMNPIILTIVKVSPRVIIVESTNIILTKKLCSLQKRC